MGVWECVVLIDRPVVHPVPRLIHTYPPPMPRARLTSITEMRASSLQNLALALDILFTGCRHTWITKTGTLRTSRTIHGEKIRLNKICLSSRRLALNYFAATSALLFRNKSWFAYFHVGRRSENNSI